MFTFKAIFVLSQRIKEVHIQSVNQLKDLNKSIKLCKKLNVIQRREKEFRPSRHRTLKQFITMCLSYKNGLNNVIK